MSPRRRRRTPAIGKTDISQSREATLRIDPARQHDLPAQFGALCWRKRDDGVQILLITSRRTGRWVVPKGWPIGGETPAGTAAIEAFEEAGVEGVSGSTCLGTYTREKAGGLPRMVALFPVRVTGLLRSWPEQGARRRRWFSLKKAADKVTEPELRRIIRGFDPKTLP